MTDEFREEMIQIGAVATAIIHDRDKGGTGNHPEHLRVIEAEIAMERARQELKWGSQHHDPIIWMLILMEEVGEAADAILLPEAEDLMDDLESAGLIGKIGYLGELAHDWLKEKFGYD